MSGGLALARLVLGEGPAFGHRLLDQRDVALALRGECPGVAGDVGRHLLRHRVVDLLAIARHRMRRPDVRAWRHRGDVGRDGDQKAGRCGATPRGRHKDRDRRLRLDDGGVDIPRRVDESPGRAEHDDEQVGLGGVSLRNRAPDMRGGDRMDDAVDLDRVDDGGALGLFDTTGSLARNADAAPKARKPSTRPRAIQALATRIGGLLMSNSFSPQRDHVESQRVREKFGSKG